MSGEPTFATPRDVLRAVAGQPPLGEGAFQDALAVMSTPQATLAQQTAFLSLLRARGESVDELTGAARLLRDTMRTVQAPPGAIDIVGTGGDGHDTYNISTAVAFVVAGADLPVAKHGNRAVSSRSGASDVLAALGVAVDASRAHVERAIREAGIGFLWAPLYHPTMKTWAPARAEIGFRTIFNLMGPLCNPAGVTRHLVGVFDQVWVTPMAKALQNLGATSALVVSGADGMDELTTTGLTHAALLRDGKIRALRINPEDAGLPRATLADLRGGDAQTNADALKALLMGDQGPYRDIVLLNAAAALIVAGHAPDFEIGVKQAARSIDDRKALAALTALIDITNAPAR